jgi:hypothetical protein
MAALLAALLVAPRWWLLATDPPAGIRVATSPWGADHQGADEAQYYIVTRRAYDGDLPVRDPVLSDHVQPPQGDALPQEVIGTLSRPFRDIFPGIAIAVTLAAFMGFLLLYVLAVDVAPPLLAAASLPIVALIAQVYTQADGFVALRHVAVLRAVMLLDPPRQFHVWGRFAAPVMLLLPFFGAVITIPRAVDTGKRGWIAAAALSLAILVYSYFFYWTAFALALAGWLAYLVLRRDLAAARRLAAVGVVAALLASPELVSLVRQSLTMNADPRIRLGVDPSVGIDFSALIRVIERLVLGVPLVWGLRSGRRRDAFYAALFASPLMIVCVEGVFPQPWHDLTVVWSVFAVPAAVTGAAGIAGRLWPRTPRAIARFGMPLVAAAALVGVLHLAVLQVRATRDVNAAFALSEDEHAAFSWMAEHVRSGETVVSTSVTTNQLLAPLTPASLYVPDGFLSRVDDQELFDRYLRASAAFGYDEQITFSRIDPALGGADHLPPYELRYESFMAYYLTNWEVVIDPQRIAARMPALRERFRALKLSSSPLAAYPADYIYCGHRERFWPGSHAAPGTRVRVVFHRGEATIYRISDASDSASEPFAGCG